MIAVRTAPAVAMSALPNGYNTNNKHATPEDQGDYKIWGKHD